MIEKEMFVARGPRRRRRRLSAVAVGLVLGGAAACAGGATTPSTTARTTAAPTTRFVSKRYGYSIVLPGRSSDWSASYALVGWTANAVHPGSPAFDTFSSQADARRYVVGARRPPTGSTLGRWTSFVASILCSRPKSFASAKLSGASARVFSWSCADLNAIGITAIHAGRGYFLWVVSPKTTSGASNRSVFETARRSFRFVSG
jgi:hypothetical protein